MGPNKKVREGSEPMNSLDENELAIGLTNLISQRISNFEGTNQNKADCLRRF